MEEQIDNKGAVETANTGASKITSVLGHMKNFSQQYLTIVTFVGIIWGGFAAYGKWRENDRAMQDKVKTMIDLQKEQRKNDSLLIIGQRELRSEVDSLKSAIQQETGTRKTLQSSYVRYISNDQALTKKEFLDYMQGLTVEEKKN